MAPSHYLNQCWTIVNCTLRNKLQWNLDQNRKFFIHENAFEILVWETAAILSRGRWVNRPEIYNSVEVQHIHWLRKFFKSEAGKNAFRRFFPHETYHLWRLQRGWLEGCSPASCGLSQQRRTPPTEGRATPGHVIARWVWLLKIPDNIWPG